MRIGSPFLGSPTLPLKSRLQRLSWVRLPALLFSQGTLVLTAPRPSQGVDSFRASLPGCDT